MKPRALYSLVIGACLLLVGTLAFPQTVINGGRQILGLLDASGATHTLPFKVVANVGALPGTCTQGELAFVTAATAGQQIYECSATNTWTQQINTGSSSGGGLITYSASSLTVTAGTYYFPIGGGGGSSGTETNVDVDSPAAATLTNFYVQSSVALGAGNTGVFTLSKNATPQSVTCTISGASATSCSDTTHSFSVSQGDLLTVKLVTTGTLVVTPNLTWAMQFGSITASGTISSGTNGQLPYYNGAGTALSGATMAGDCTFAQPNITCTKTNGHNLVYPSGYYLTDGTAYYIAPYFTAATLPSTGNYSWANQGSATDTANGNAITEVVPAGAGDNWRMRVKSISTDTTLIAAIQCMTESRTFRHCAIVLRESGTSKISAFSILAQTGATGTQSRSLWIGSYSNNTTFSAAQYAGSSNVPESPLWLKVVLSGANILYSYSVDGINYIQVLSLAKTTPFTTAPDQWGYGMDIGNTDSSASGILTLLSWATS